MGNPEESIRAEIEFWRDFIDNWRLSHDEPAPAKAYELLVYAEAKLASRIDRDESDSVS